MKSARSLLVAALALLACQPPGIPDEDSDSQADAPGPDAAEDPSSDDPWSCGEEELKCVGPLGIGECVDGVCQGRLGSCGPAEGTCAELCSTYEGAVCAELDCEEATAFVWDRPTQEEADALCISGAKDAAIPLAIGCEDELSSYGNSAMCCCSFP